MDNQTRQRWSRKEPRRAHRIGVPKHTETDARRQPRSPNMKGKSGCPYSYSCGAGVGSRNAARGGRGFSVRTSSGCRPLLVRLAPWLMLNRASGSKISLKRSVVAGEAGETVAKVTKGALFWSKTEVSGSGGAFFCPAAAQQLRP